LVNNAHVFVVDATTFPVHRDRLFCGVKNPYNENTRHGLYADLFAVRPGDLVFFYQSRIDEPRKERGFRGIYRAISPPFFDKSNVRGFGDSRTLTVYGKCPNPKCREPYSLKSGKAGALGSRKCPICKKEHGQHILPNRVLIAPVSYYLYPVDDNTAYINHTNHGMLWTMLFRKTFGAGRARSITHILPEEAQKLARLLRRVNNNNASESYEFKIYKEPDQVIKKRIELDLGPGPETKFESSLEAWIIRNIDKNVPILSEIVGPREELEYFGNNVLYGIGGEKVDILCLHKKAGVRYKATVIELKKGRVPEEALSQIEDYAYWIGQLSTANVATPIEKLDIQPVLIGRGATPNLKKKLVSFKPWSFPIPLATKCNATVKEPILLAYEVSKKAISFDRTNN
jgi:hypothetical protein